MNKAFFAFIVVFSAALSADMTSVFDGRSLAGWHVSGDAQWSVDNGEIVSAGAGDGYLYSDAIFGDFELRAEFWVDATTNSGIYIRCQDIDNIHPDTCFELNIWDQHPKQEARTGSIVFKVMPPLAQVETIGRWNTYEVTARGSSLVVKVNGTLTATMDDADPAAGFIALQHWATGTVKFRKVQLRPLAN
ncbi:MAG: DUF1080 domain-containing protein [Halioglobus sp.]